MEIRRVGIHLKSICEVPARPYLVTDARGPWRAAVSAVAWPALPVDGVSDVDDFQFAIDNCRPGLALISEKCFGSIVIAVAAGRSRVTCCGQLQQRTLMLA